MSTIIIFEGIPTSGKSILIHLLKQQIKGSVEVLSYNTLQLALSKSKPADQATSFYKDLNNIVSKNPDYILIHNFYLSTIANNQISGQEDSIKNYSEILKILKEHNTLIVNVQLQGRIILSQFDKTIELKKSKGEDYPLQRINDQKGTRLQQLAFYTVLQDKYCKLVDQSEITAIHKKITKETTYQEIAKEILDKVSEYKGFLEFTEEVEE